MLAETTSYFTNRKIRTWIKRKHLIRCSWMLLSGKYIECTERVLCKRFQYFHLLQVDATQRERGIMNCNREGLNWYSPFHQYRLREQLLRRWMKCISLSLLISHSLCRNRSCSYVLNLPVHVTLSSPHLPRFFVRRFGIVLFCRKIADREEEESLILWSSWTYLDPSG
jgi:hypothetical protein